MTGWIVLAVYVTGWAWCSRKAAVYFADEFAGNDQDAVDRFSNRILGVLVGLLWPFAIPVLLLTWRLPKGRKQAEAERDEMQQRIKDLERELNIR